MDKTQNTQSKFHTRTSGFLATGLIGLIIISFMITSYQTSSGDANTLASVDGRNITIDEFQQAYNRQLQFYGQFMGQNGQLTQEQIRQFRIRESVLQGLINRKLLEGLASKLKISATPLEVKNVIKDLPYFQENGGFHFENYREALRRSGMTPLKFEENVGQDLIQEKIQTLFSNMNLAQNYVDDVERFKNQKIKADVLLISSDKLSEYLPVSTKELTDFLKESSKVETLTNLFQARKASLDQKEEIQASHILLSTMGKDENTVLEEAKRIRKGLTTKNFKSEASKYTEDPSGKDNGGDLGQFARGAMVPEFDSVAFTLNAGEISEPVKTDFGYHLIYVQKKIAAKEATFDDHKNNLARELIRRDKTKEKDALLASILKDAESNLKAGKISEVEKLAKKYALEFSPAQEINRLDGASFNLPFSGKDLKLLFEERLNKAQTFVFKDSNRPMVVRAISSNTKSEENSDEMSIEKMENTNFQRKLNEDILASISANVSMPNLQKVMALLGE